MVNKLLMNLSYLQQQCAMGPPSRLRAPCARDDDGRSPAVQRPPRTSINSDASPIPTTRSAAALG
jgi:hypothetical protein